MTYVNTVKILEVVFTIILGVHFFIVLPIQLKICRSKVFPSFHKTKCIHLKNWAFLGSFKHPRVHAQFVQARNKAEKVSAKVANFCIDEDYILKIGKTDLKHNFEIWQKKNGAPLIFRLKSSTTTEFCSETLTNQAIRPWIQLPPRTNFLLQLQSHCSSSVISVSVTVSFHLLPAPVASFTLIEIFLR